MILFRYGNTVESVDPDFDSRALTEISFRRNRNRSVNTDEFFDDYERREVRELEARTEGPVHDEAEQALLEELLGRLREVESALGEGEVLMVENERGKDYPKTRDTRKNVVVDGENRLYFYLRVEPPLKIGVYRKKG